MDYEIIRLPESAGRVPLAGEFFPEELAEPWRSLNEARVAHYPWADGYTPECAARVGWNESGIHVLMYAQEPVIRAEVTQTGGDIYTDSCVEFFLSPDAGRLRYINIEVNPLAVLHVGLGDGRHDRTVLRALSEAFAPAHSDHRGGWWAVSYTIPADFILEQFGVRLSAGLMMRGNFYKCGDAQRHAHYGMFKPYDTPKSDYHRPELFAPMALG